MMANLNLLSSDIDNVINVINSATVEKPECCKSLLISSEEQFRALTLNIRSLNHNFDELQVLLVRLDLEFDVIVLTECWLNGNKGVPSLLNYKAVSTERNFNQNDGVVIYIKNQLTFNTYEPNNIKDANCLVTTLGMEYAIISIYRPPSYRRLDDFISSLDSILTDHKRFKNIILIGDININIIDTDQANNYSSYLDMLASHGLTPTHKLPTRGNSCLDHCMVKTRLPNKTLVCDTSVTDHSPVLFSISKVQMRMAAPIRTLKKVDYKLALAELDHVDWDSLLGGADVNYATNTFLHTVNKTINKFTTLKKVSHRKHNLQPWITIGILRCLRHRDKLHQYARCNPNNDIIKITYKRYRNTCNRMLKSVKRNYQRSLIKKHNNNLKQQWSVIKQICNFKNTPDSDKHILQLKPSPQESLNHANSYFVNIGKQLANTIIHETKLTEADRLKIINPTSASLNSMTLLPTDEHEVRATILSLKTSHSTGWDGISSYFLKLGINTMVSPITWICNLCLCMGKFPDALKKSIISPIHKAGERENIENYRPISLLPTLAKILEKIINKRLKGFLEKNNILSSNQHGFRERKSTNDAMLQLTNFIVDKLDKNKKALGLFLDLKKAFDTVSVPLLIKKLENKGIRGLPLQLFQDYLSGRKQAVVAGDLCSEEESINYGVPQGSVLGPTLFLIYIDDLCRIVLKNTQIITFADDTVLLFYGNSWSDTNKLAQDGFNEVTEWLSTNLLTLNLSKTKFIPFSIRNSSLPAEDSISIQAHSCQQRNNCKCPRITEAQSIRYLGIQIDRNLNFKEHIDSLTGRVRKLIYIFKSLRHVCDRKLLITIYSALCQSIICYCINVWGGVPKTSLLKLERAQRMVLKVMAFKNYTHPTSTLYKEISVLTVRQLFIKHLILLQHKNAPDFHESRRRYDIVYSIPTCNTKFAKRFPMILGPVIYNKISKSIDLRALTSYSCKRKLDEYLKLLYYESTEYLIK